MTSFNRLLWIHIAVLMIGGGRAQAQGGGSEVLFANIAEVVSSEFISGAAPSQLIIFTDPLDLSFGSEAMLQELSLAIESTVFDVIDENGCIVDLLATLSRSDSTELQKPDLILGPETGKTLEEIRSELYDDAGQPLPGFQRYLETKAAFEAAKAEYDSLPTEQRTAEMLAVLTTLEETFRGLGQPDIFGSLERDYQRLSREADTEGLLERIRPYIRDDGDKVWLSLEFSPPITDLFVFKGWLSSRRQFAEGDKAGATFTSLTVNWSDFLTVNSPAGKTLSLDGSLTSLSYELLGPRVFAPWLEDFLALQKQVPGCSLTLIPDRIILVRDVGVNLSLLTSALEDNATNINESSVSLGNLQFSGSPQFGFGAGSSIYVKDGELVSSFVQLVGITVLRLQE